MTQHFGTPATSEPVSAETPETIKQKYESNPDTNAFTNSDKASIENILDLVGNVNTMLDLINGEVAP